MSLTQSHCKRLNILKRSSCPCAPNLLSERERLVHPSDFGSHSLRRVILASTLIGKEVSKQGKLEPVRRLTLPPTMTETSWIQVLAVNVFEMSA